jgi:hypothetical protein
MDPSRPTEKRRAMQMTLIRRMRLLVKKTVKGNQVTRRQMVLLSTLSRIDESGSARRRPRERKAKQPVLKSIKYREKTSGVGRG